MSRVYIENDPDVYVPTTSELANKVVRISGTSVSILSNFKKSISELPPKHQVGGLLVSAAKKIGRIKISDAYFFEGYIKRQIARRGEDWPADAALQLLDELIAFFNNMEHAQMEKLFG